MAELERQNGRLGQLMHSIAKNSKQLRHSRPKIDRQIILGE